MYDEFEDEEMKKGKRLDDGLQQEIEAALMEINNGSEEDGDSTLMKLIEQHSLQN